MSGFFDAFLRPFRRTPAPAPAPATPAPPLAVIPTGPITLALMHAAAPHTPSARLLPCIDALNMACHEFNVLTVPRYTKFLAQLAHESDGFMTACEYASGAAYEGRRDLGNTSPGDGRKYRGHGWIQVTGKANHLRAAEFFGIAVADVVDWLQTPSGAARSAGWYWTRHQCNALADADDFDAITRAINGGLNGKADRDARLAAILVELAEGM
jgi:putative chitinase